MFWGRIARGGWDTGDGARGGLSVFRATGEAGRAVLKS